MVEGIDPPKDDDEARPQARPTKYSPAESPVDEHPPQETPESTSTHDKLRTRRRKARRACANCQRAHLTCEDERPCMRCRKRGLAHNCHDGARKKAKYLYDAPDDSLSPSTVPDGGIDAALQPQLAQAPSGATPLTLSTNMPIAYPSSALSHASAAQMTPTGFVGEHGPQSQQQQQQQQQIQQIQSPSHPHPQSQHGPSRSTSGSVGQRPDSSLFELDVANLNFDNYFGALEFGILGHMSSGAIGSSDDGMPISPSDPSMANLSASTPGSVDANGHHIQLYSPNKTAQMHWQYASQPMQQQSSGRTFDAFNTPQLRALKPTRSMTIAHGIHESAAYASGPAAPALPHINDENELAAPHRLDAGKVTFQRHFLEAAGPPKVSTSSLPIKRDASHIYTSVETPYSYTAGFHALAALLQRRFTPQKTLRIAKALASIRPSFITCTKDLKLDDLTFMEKCFQRTLLQYDDFINAYGCPTIICRRTGELAAASKEFTQMTGWQGDVLLGDKPNLNINHGSSMAPVTGTKRAGPPAATATATATAAGKRASRPQGVTTDRVQPVFLAELLDEDSVVQFYEDFAELAFGDPRGHVVRPCKLLKYLVDGHETLGTSATPKGSSIDCMYCWSVKRDVFDIPMLIVINFLPRF